MKDATKRGVFGGKNVANLTSSVFPPKLIHHNVKGDNMEEIKSIRETLEITLEKAQEIIDEIMTLFVLVNEMEKSGNKGKIYQMEEYANDQKRMEQKRV